GRALRRWPEGRGRGPRACLSRDRAPVARSLLPLHAGRRPRTCRALARGGRLCGRRHEGARRSLPPQRRRGQAARADEIAMTTGLIGIVALLIILWFMHKFVQASRKGAGTGIQTG